MVRRGERTSCAATKGWPKHHYASSEAERQAFDQMLSQAMQSLVNESDGPGYSLGHLGQEQRAAISAMPQHLTERLAKTALLALVTVIFINNPDGAEGFEQERPRANTT
jgi:hypothetical protein